MTTATVKNGQASAEGAERTPAQEIDKRNLWQRLRDVKIALGGTIAKTGTAPAVMGGFAFVEWDDVAEKIGTLLAENGVMSMPSVAEHSIEHVGDTSTGKPIYRADVRLVIELVNVDNPEDRTSLTWAGTGDDGSDKSVQKACTSAEKYALLKLFMLRGANTPDSDTETPDGVDRPTTPPQTRPAPANAADLCPQCQMAGFKNKRGYPPKFWPGRNGRPDQCDGVDAEGDYQNHQRKPDALPALTGVGAAVERVADQQTFADGTPVPQEP